MDAEILAEYERLAGELKRNREALVGLVDRIKQTDGSLKLTKEAEASWDRLDREYARDWRALKKLVASKVEAGRRSGHAHADRVDKEEEQVQMLRETLRQYAAAADESDKAPSGQERDEAERKVVGLLKTAKAILVTEPDD